ncbi:T-cell differentiation antigen CD6-like isoform X1 [Seriola dumerili]|uniref:T-cell differentiation antigen CD6-like isoform X1 n=2 Tax=Seriola dumerili TaxID=41447 RepID=UPI000BBE350D|nr:T-cell differentiation antigen CD6-like isoform X1 [Seriola dumerili]XP_022613019.1 T-cell differentiation antigen CD6-like isoform X1 [Seriola dumerili]
MKLVKYFLIIHLSCVCQALQNSSTPTDTTEAPVETEGNSTEGMKQEESNSDPYVLHLAGRCEWTLRLPGNRSSDVVWLSSDSMAALVEQVCRDLDCGSVYDVDQSSSPPNTTCFHGCLYKDGHLQNCSQSVGSECTVITSVVCGHQPVRLAGGPDRCAGRVELWRDGRWGTVCDDQWDLRDANLVCAQLSCGYALNVTGQDGPFPPGRGPVHLDELNCTGREENLWACPSAQEEPDCGHKEDAGVICSEMRAIRLTGGLDRCSGKVEVHRNGSWGTVCDHCWNVHLASMACSMLQCGAEPLQFSQFVPPLTHNNGTLWYYSCGSKEQSLWQCRELINKAHLCAGSKASGVICNGSRGFITDATDNTTAITSWTTAASTTTVAADELFLTVSPELLITMSVSLLLLVFLITNSVLCCHYRRRHAFLLQQTRSSSRPSPGHHHNNYAGPVDLVKVTTTTQPQTEVPPNPRYVWTQLSSADSTSVDTDYEQFDPSSDPSVPLSTFKNSQKRRHEKNPLMMRTSGLDSLFEEGTEPAHEETGAFTSYSVDCLDAQYARVSKISVDSFDTSSTSSGECYENVNNGYIMVTPDPEEGQSPDVIGAFDPSRQNCGQTTNLSSSDEEDGPIYSPVSPDGYNDLGTQ